jgi:hypothetical protein
MSHSPDKYRDHHAHPRIQLLVFAHDRAPASASRQPNVRLRPERTPPISLTFQYRTVSTCGPTDRPARARLNFERQVNPEPAGSRRRPVVYRMHVVCINV